MDVGKTQKEHRKCFGNSGRAEIIALPGGPMGSGLRLRRGNNKQLTGTEGPRQIVVVRLNARERPLGVPGGGGMKRTNHPDLHSCPELRTAKVTDGMLKEKTDQAGRCRKGRGEGVGRHRRDRSHRTSVKNVYFRKTTKPQCLTEGTSGTFYYRQWFKTINKK